MAGGSSPGRGAPRHRGWRRRALLAPSTLLALLPGLWVWRSTRAGTGFVVCGRTPVWAPRSATSLPRLAQGWASEGPQIGDGLDGTVVQIARGKGVHVATDGGQDGFIAVGELQDGFPVEGITLQKGDRVSARVLDATGERLELTLRSGDLQRPTVPDVPLPGQPGAADLEPFAKLAPVEWLQGTALSMTVRGVWVAVAPPGGGQPAAGFLRRDAFRDGYAEEAISGGAVNVRIVSVNPERGLMRLSMLEPAVRLSDLQVGDRVEGTVVREVGDTGVLLDCDADAEAFLSASESQDGFPEDGIGLKVGDNVTALVLNKDGGLQVTLRKGSLERDPPLPAEGQAESVLNGFSRLSPDEWTEGTVSGMTTNGIFLTLRPPQGGEPAAGFLHRKDFEWGVASKITQGCRVAVRVLGVDLLAGSLKLGMRYPAKRIVELQIGDEVTGRVTRQWGQAGVFVDCGLDKDGYIEAGELRDGFPSDGITLKAGDTVTARVLRIEQNPRKLWLTLRTGSLKRGRRYKVVPQNEADVSQFQRLSEDHWIKGTVNEMSNVGVFVALPPLYGSQRVSGLLHKSEFREGFVDEAIIGGEVGVRVISVDVAKGSVKLSMLRPSQRLQQEAQGSSREGRRREPDSRSQEGRFRDDSYQRGGRRERDPRDTGGSSREGRHREPDFRSQDGRFRDDGNHRGGRREREPGGRGGDFNEVGYRDREYRDRDGGHGDGRYREGGYREREFRSQDRGYGDDFREGRDRGQRDRSNDDRGYREGGAGRNDGGPQRGGRRPPARERESEPKESPRSKKRVSPSRLLGALTGS